MRDFPGAAYDAWKTTEPDHGERALSYIEEVEREQRWAALIGEMRDFAKVERDGWAAVARCLAEAIKAQGELPL